MEPETLTEEHAATLTYIHAVDDPEIPDERFKLWTPQELLDSNAPPVWTIKGLVIKPTYRMLAGAEKSLKSYLAQIVAVGGRCLLAAGKFNGRNCVLSRVPVRQVVVVISHSLSCRMKVR
jgi:hypothetical protein